jgi:hypothetical protein
MELLGEMRKSAFHPTPIAMEAFVFPTLKIKVGGKGRGMQLELDHKI